MPIITLTTDFGHHSHFVAELKGNIAKNLPDCSVIDITHSITPFQLIETSFILKNSIFHFPANTIHAVGVDSSLELYKAIIIGKMEDQFLVAADNGIVPMVFHNGEYQYKRIEVSDKNYFSFKNSFPNYIKQLIDNKYKLDKLQGEQKGITNKLMQNPVINGNIISFKIIYIDTFGNAYTTLTRQFFEQTVGNKKFNIKVSRVESIEKIDKNYSDVAEGAKVCFFDENNYLVIAINKGRADQLLSLKRDFSQLMIEIFD